MGIQFYCWVFHIYHWIGFDSMLARVSYSLRILYLSGNTVSVNPEFASAFSQMLLLLFIGIFLVGMGLGSMLSSRTIRMLEKKIPENPPPPTNPQQPSSI
jgi:cell division protein FtsX